MGKNGELLLCMKRFPVFGCRLEIRRSKISLFDCVYRHFFSGPQTKSFSALKEKHVQSVEGEAAFGFGYLHQPRFSGIVNYIDTTNSGWSRESSERMHSDSWGAMPTEVPFVRMELSRRHFSKDAASAKS